MITNTRVRISNIYRYIDLPDGLENEIDLAYHRYKIKSEKPFGDMYIEVHRITAVPEDLLRKDLENLLSFYGLKKHTDASGEYYR